MSKKYVLIILPILFAFSGCRAENNALAENNTLDGYVDVFTVACNTQDELQYYIEINDAYAISDLFCDAESVTVEEIQTLLDVIDGNIITVGSKLIHNGAAESIEGRYTYYTYAATMKVGTDLDMEYIVAFGGIAVWDGHPEQIGIDSFTIIDEQTGERYDI